MFRLSKMDIIGESLSGSMRVKEGVYPPFLQQLMQDTLDWRHVAPDGTRRRCSVLVPDSLFGEWVQELEELSPKKRGQWKARLVDQQGQRTSTRFRDNTIVNWSVIDGVWKVIMPQSMANATMKPLSYRSVLGTLILTEEEDAVDQMIEVNRTGHHHRNKLVRVPKGPDGGVRA